MSRIAILPLLAPRAPRLVLPPALPPRQLSLVFCEQRVLVFPPRPPAAVRRTLRGPQPTAAQFQFARRIAKAEWRRIGRTVDLDDLEGYAMSGLLETLQRFDPKRGVEFEGYAYRRIRGAIYDGLRQMGWLSPADYAAAGRTVGRVGLESAEAVRALGAGGGGDLEAAVDVGRILHSLSGAEAELVARCDLGGETLEAVGHDLGVSKSWASRQRKRAVERLREAI